MQQQTVEALCIQVRLGRSSMVSLPAEFLPKRINWAKWCDGIAASLHVKKNRLSASPRLCMSPDHQDPKDNLAYLSTQNQSGLEQLDLFKLMSSVIDDAKLLFVGSWSQTLPSWFKSLQAVFSAKYSSVMQDVLAQQVKTWAALGESLELRENFLVVDDVGRLSPLASMSKMWRSRHARANLLAETRSFSWFAATLELHMSKASEGQALRLHRLQIFKPDEWCGSPHFAVNVLNDTPNIESPPEAWISAPGAGMGLWIADQCRLLSDARSKLIMPGIVLGWHPLRDLIAFISEATPGSIMLMVDGDVNLQVLMKESDGST